MLQPRLSKKHLPTSNGHHGVKAKGFAGHKNSRKIKRSPTINKRLEKLSSEGDVPGALDVQTDDFLAK